MPSPKLISFLLVAAFTIQASLNEVRAAPGSEIQALNEPTQQVSTPGEARIVSDVTSYYQFVGTTALGEEPGGYVQADSSAIRSSVRKGEVLEFRVTSVYYADSNGGPPREVDSIASYQLVGDRWALLGVQIEGTRNVNPGDPNNASERC